MVHDDIREEYLQSAEMAARDDDTAIVIPTATELKHPTMNLSVENVHKEFTVCKTLAKMWLENDGCA